MNSLPDAILVTADVTALYPSTPPIVGLKALREAWDKREQKKNFTKELVQMAEFVLKNNFLEFNGQIKQQISGKTIGTKCDLEKLVTFFTDFLAFAKSSV